MDLSRIFGGGNVPKSNIGGGNEPNWHFLMEVELALIISSMVDL